MDPAHALTATSPGLRRDGGGVGVGVGELCLEDSLPSADRQRQGFVLVLGDGPGRGRRLMPAVPTTSSPRGAETPATKEKTMAIPHAQPTPQRLLLRVEEAAERLGIARTSMFHLLATEQIESVRVGRLRRVPVACLEEYVERLRREHAVLVAKAVEDG